MKTKTTIKSLGFKGIIEANSEIDKELVYTDKGIDVYVNNEYSGTIARNKINVTYMPRHRAGGSEWIEAGYKVNVVADNTKLGKFNNFDRINEDETNKLNELKELGYIA